MTISRKLKDYLDSQGVAYEVISHEVSFTSQETAAVTHVSGRMLAKPVILEADGRTIMAVLPAHLKVNLKALAKGADFDKVAMVPEKDFAGVFADSDVGAESPFGNLYDLDVYADKSLAEDAEIVFNAGSHTEAVKMKYADFERLARPKVLEFGVLAG